MSCLAVCLLPFVHTAPVSVAWCYHIPWCSDTVWSTISKECNGTEQSPINIVTADVQANTNLTSFNFTGYDDDTNLIEIKNTGHSIKVALDHEKMHVEGGDLPGLFTSMQFHLHWGNGSTMPGSEHTVDGKQYPMELHIVNKALTDSTLAVLGFFIEGTNDTGKPESWKTLTSYLADVANAGDEACITEYISMNDLLPGVDRTKYYRYHGSLTTPNCNEGVMWTIFKEPVKVSKDLIDLFSTNVFINKASSSSLMTNNFRHIQPINGRIVTSQVTDVAGPIVPLPTNSCLSDPSVSQTEVSQSTFDLVMEEYW